MTNMKIMADMELHISDTKSYGTRMWLERTV